ncbi:MAG: hypothetical protein KA314_18915 [Chloroflexi bacterium]|nr:hypothetical protein [Chloroflexota bacterium]MBP8057906.1 hypothetical protein [Chloroflexota bacterium]
MAVNEQTQGLTCPNCASVVPVPEGVRIIECPSCHLRSFVQGEQGVRRWQVARKVEREQAERAVKGFFTGINKAADLKRKAEIKEMFLAYLPYWRVAAMVAGWMFGRVKSGKDNTRPVEVEIMEEMHWNDAAADVSEFGVHQVSLSKTDLLPYDSDQLHAEGMVFEPAESPTDALEEARQHFEHRGRNKRSLARKFFEKFHVLRQQLALVYYPLWVARYEYRGRNYQVVVDGVKGSVLYGKAPGNIFYRAAMLVGGMALGNLILVNGTVIAARLFVFVDSDEDGTFLLLCAPAVIGLGLIAAAYQAFRYGEEVESRQKGAEKAVGVGSRATTDNSPVSAVRNMMGDSGGDFLTTGLKVLEELSEISRKS